VQNWKPLYRSNLEKPTGLKELARFNCFVGIEVIFQTVHERFCQVKIFGFAVATKHRFTALKQANCKFSGLKAKGTGCVKTSVDGSSSDESQVARFSASTKLISLRVVNFRN